MAKLDQLEFSEGQLRLGPVGVLLTPKERALLAALAQAGGHPVASATLIESVWGLSPVGSESLHRCISTLRSKLSRHTAEKTITSIHGYGYRLDLPLRVNDTDVAVEGFRLAMEMVGRRSKPELTMATKRLAELRRSYPGFQPAYIFGAHAEVTLALYRYEVPAEAGARAAEIARHLIDGDTAPCADAYSVRGFVTAVIEGDDSGLDDLDRAVRLEPRNWLVRYYRAWALAGRGKFAAATSDLEAAWEANAAAVGLIGTFAYVLFCAGEPERALSLLRDTKDQTCLSSAANAAHAIIASCRGHHDEAIAAGQRAAEVPLMSATFSSALAFALAGAGRTEEGAAALAGVQLVGAPSMLAPVYAALGDTARARALLQEADAERCPFRHFQRYDPRLRSLGP